MWINDSGFWTGEFEFKEFIHSVAFIDKVAILSFSTDLKSMWTENVHIVKVKVKIDRNSDCTKVIKKIDNIYFQKK